MKAIKKGNWIPIWINKLSFDLENRWNVLKSSFDPSRALYVYGVKGCLVEFAQRNQDKENEIKSTRSDLVW